MDGTGRLWGPLRAALGRDVRVVRYEGDDHDAIEQALPDALRAPSPTDVLVAESYGGPLALRIAARHPVARVVLVASFVTSPRVLPPSWLVALTHPPSSLGIRAAMLGLDAPASLVADVSAALADVSARTIAARVRSLCRLDVRAELAAARGEVIWLRAARDRLVPARQTELALAARPALDVHVVDGPHLLAQRRADDVARFVK
jgi:pimeloyl-ACP methyl ester carboxylesterase